MHLSPFSSVGAKSESAPPKVLICQKFEQNLKKIWAQKFRQFWKELMKLSFC